MDEAKNTWVSRTGSHGAQVEARLTALQDRHRLAFHMIEVDDATPLAPFTFPWQTHAQLKHAAPAALAQAWANGTPPLTSLTLMPSNASGISIQPYEYYPGQTNNYGYLIDLSQEQSAPPPVGRVALQGLISGYETLAKNFGFDEFLPSSPKTDPVITDWLEDYYRQLAGFTEPLLGLEAPMPLHRDAYAQLRREQHARWRHALITAMAADPVIQQ